MKNIFRLSREERLPALVALVVFVALNVLMTRYNPELFMRGGRVGFWSIFWGHFHVSGFDSFTYMTLSKWTVYYTQFRHPLLPFFWYPFAEANGWLMRETEVNYAIYFVAVAMVVFAFYSFVFLYRVFREVMELGRADACLLSLLFFSFAYIMLSVMVPDHFGISLFFLTMTLYVAGRRLKAGRAMSWWQTALLFVLTAGVTISNGAKVFLAALFANGKTFFRLRHLFLAVVVPAAVIGAVAVWQNEAFIKPHVVEGLRIQQANEQKNRKVAEQNKKYVDRIAEVQGEKVDKKGVLSWTDMSVSRPRSVVDNLFGESLQLHEDHLLEDIYVSRPLFVPYRWAFNDAVELLLVLLFAAGLWAGRHSKFLWMVAAWVALDMFIHLGLGFGLNEVYIMTAHWAFIIPIAIGFLLKAVPEKWLFPLRSLLLFLALFLFFYNGKLIYQYIIH